MIFKKNKSSKQIDKTFFALGTINNIMIFDSKKESAVEKAIARVYEIDDRMSVFKKESDISIINKNAGLVSQRINKDTFDLIDTAVKFSSISEGAFDITIRPLVELWGINKKANYIPEDSEINEALKLVSYKDISLDKKSYSIALKKHGQAVDLGGIAKGYAADEVKRILTKNGIKSALINLGGNVITIGKRPDEKLWQIGIQNPLAPTGKYLGILSVNDKTVVTSGSNERFFMKDGIRYHHILDPRTGKPAQSGILSVTAVCNDSTDADALTTALFILGPEKSMPLLQKMNAEALFVKEDLSLIVSKGLEKNFSFE